MVRHKTHNNCFKLTKNSQHSEFGKAEKKKKKKIRNDGLGVSAIRCVAGDPAWTTREIPNPIQVLIQIMELSNHKSCLHQFQSHSNSITLRFQQINC